MKLPVWYFLILPVFLSGPAFSGTVPGPGPGQLVISADRQFEYAQQLFKEKDFTAARIEYKRLIHFFPDDPRTDPAEFNIAVCLFYLKDYYESARAFDQIIRKGGNDGLTPEAYFFQSRAFVNMGNSAYAQIVLQNYLKISEDIAVHDRIYFNLMKIHLEEAKKNGPESLVFARKYLASISESGREKYRTGQYEDLIQKAGLAPKKNPIAAGLFAVIPGGGFLYCERYHDALVTFLLNAGLMVATYQAWENDNQALAGVIGFVETGFYSGNIYGSITSAHKYNKAQLLKILDREFSITSRFNPENNGIELSLTCPF